MECDPASTGVDADSSLVPPSYVVPSAPAADMAVGPVELILTTLWLSSNAKLFGALIVEPAVVQFEVSSSATNPSLNVVPTYSGYSSERKRKFTPMQFAPAGTLTSIL